MDLNSILNWVVPLGIIFFVMAILYKPFKPMIDSMIEIIKGIVGWFGEKGSNTASKVADYETRIVYR